MYDNVFPKLLNDKNCKYLCKYIYDLKKSRTK